MNELKRLYGIKTLLILAAAVIMNILLFMLSCDTEKEITLTGEALETRLAEYPDLIEGIEKNAGNLSALNMYKSGFVAESIQRSAKAYKKLGNITVTLGDNRGIILLFDYRLTDIFLVVFLLITASRLLTERKKGLVYFVRSTVKGRGYLYFTRVAVLFISALAGGVLFYGGNFIAVLIRFGSCGLGRSIQSLPEFMLCPYKLTVGETLLLTFVLKTAVCFTAAFAFFLIISVSGTFGAYVISVVITAAELLLYKLIIPVSSVNVLKFINLFALTNGTEFFGSFRCLDIFGKAVPASGFAFGSVIAASIFMLGAGYIIHGKMYVLSGGFLDGILNKLSAFAERHAVQRTLMSWEMFKLLIKQYGILFIVAVLMLTYNAVYKYDYIYSPNITEVELYEKYKGEITADTLKAAEHDLTRLDESIERQNKRIEDILARESYDPNDLGKAYAALSEFTSKRECLLPVIENIKSGLAYTEKTGNSIMLVKPYTYDLLLNHDKQTRTLCAVYLLIGITGTVSGAFAYEKKNNMQNTLRASPRGRGTLTAAKILTIAAICIPLSVLAQLIRFVRIGELLGYNDLSAPIQSLEFMRGFTMYISIFEYLLLHIAVIAVCCCLIGVGSSAAGSKM